MTTPNHRPPVGRMVGLGLMVVGLFTLVGVVSAEATMEMSPNDRTSAALFFAAVGVVATIALATLPRITRHLSLRVAITFAAFVGPALALAATLVGSQTMFLSGHDSRLLILLLLAGVACGLAAAAAVVVPVSRELDQVRDTLDAVAGGRLDARTGLSPDSGIGAVAQSVDELAASLHRAEADRARAEHERNVVLASVSHDLRTPLTALRAALEAVQDGVSPDPDRYLASMHHDLDAVDALVEDLFLLGRLEAGRYEVEPVAVRLGEIVDEAIEALTPVATAVGVGIRSELGCGPAIRAGPRDLSRVVRNLLDNAIRHAPAGSDVVVELDLASDWPTVRIVDDGPGFSEEFREHAFERFRRSDDARTRAGGGAGLGLAIARGLVEAHGGRIWADAGPGGRVSFSIPPGVS